MDVERLQTAIDSVDPAAWVLFGAVALIVLLVGLLIGWGTASRRREQQYRQRFGPEYERVRHETGDRSAAEVELERREQHVRRFDIRPLTPEEHERYASAWQQIQTRFVDNPTGATADADQLIVQVMQARGYPTGDFEQQAEDLSVDHPDVVEHYRAAHTIAARNQREEAGTEELRQAMVHYRHLFDALLVSEESEREPQRRAAEAD